MPNEARSRHLLHYARLAVGLLCIAVLIPTLAAPDFWKTLASVNLPLVLLALVLSVASVASKAWRWGLVMRWRGIVLSPTYLLFSYFIGMFFNNILPSSVSGDVVRAYEAARDTGRGKESVVAVMIERGSGMLAVFAAGSIGALLVPNLPLGVTLFAHALFVGSIIIIWALWQDWTGRLLAVLQTRLSVRLAGSWGKIIRIYDEFRIYRREWSLLLELMLQSVVTLILTLASVYTLLLAFDQHVLFTEFAAVFSIITAIDVLPISLNGLGIREGSYVFFLGTIGIAAPIALGVALLVRLLVLLQAMVGGIVFVARNLQKQAAVE